MRGTSREYAEIGPNLEGQFLKPFEPSKLSRNIEISKFVFVENRTPEKSIASCKKILSRSDTRNRRRQNDGNSDGRTEAVKLYREEKKKN